MRGKALQVAQLLLVVAPAFILFGYNQSGVGGLLSINSWTETFPRIDTVHTTGARKANNSTIQGLVVATFTLGALCGSLSCSWFGDRFGRRKTIFAGATLTLIGEILQCTSFSLPQFIVGRTILGSGIGFLSATVPVWQSESSSASNRGKHVVLDGCFISFGYTLQAWIDLGFYQFKSGSISWRLPLALPCLVSVGLMLSIWMFPESPRWLVKEGRSEDARQALSLLKDLSPEDMAVVQEVAGIEHSLEDTSNGATRLKDMFTMGEHKLFFRFSLCIFLQFLQQMCGSNLISVYSTIIFQQGLNLDSQTSRILTGGTLTWKFLSCFVAFFTIDRFGRRALFMFSGFGMAGCMTALAVATSFPTSNEAAQIASVVFVFMFNFFIPIGFLGANFLYCTEVAPTRLRVTMASISTANHWLWNFVVVMVTPVAIESIGYQYYIVFAVISGIIPISVYLFFPETMGRSLEDMEMLFTSSDSIFAAVRASLKAPSSAYTTRSGSVKSLDAEKDEKIEA